jgi:hypothetical protein
MGFLSPKYKAQGIAALFDEALYWCETCSRACTNNLGKL